MTLLALHAVGCARGGRMLFHDLTLRLDAGDACLVTGPNGVGKSSLLRLAAGLLPPARGRVERSGAVALLAEASALDGERTVKQALAFWRALDGTEGRDEDALAAVGLAHLAQVSVRLLSTGQRRRVAFARVVASAAPLWLLDEPASGLDAAAVTLLEMAIGRHRAGGGAALIATHQPLALPGVTAVVLA